MFSIDQSILSPQRQQDLGKLAGSYEDSKNVLQFLLKAEHPPQVDLGIEPVIFTRGNDRTGIVGLDQANFLQSQIESACKNPVSFLIFTPEFSLYSDHNKAEPIVFDDEGNITQGQNTVIEAFNQTRALAKKYNKCIVLSSLCEKRMLDSGTGVVLNTTAIILPNGEVTFRRKVGEVYTNTDGKWIDRTQETQTQISNPNLNQTINSDIKQIADLTYGSLKPISIKDNSGNQHEFIVIVCRERGSELTYKNLPSTTEIVIVPVSEGSLVTSRDIAAVIAYGESTYIRGFLGEKFKGKSITIALTNERANRASVISFDSEDNIDNISLR